MPVLTVLHHNQVTQIEVPVGSNLRAILLMNNLSPYARLTKRLNCRGNGLCATCGVWIETGEPDPEHWHDHLAAQFGYPRLSCQVTVDADMVIRLLDDKKIWGERDAERARWNAVRSQANHD